MFNQLKNKVQSQFKSMTQTGSQLFVSNVSQDLIYETYLNSFTDPIERQGHTCNCCKQFLRYYGGLVIIKDNKLVTIWDFEFPGEYENTISEMKHLISSSSVGEKFVIDITKLGTDKSIQGYTSGEDGKQVRLESPIIWNHFYLEMEKARSNRSSKSNEALMGEARDSKNTFYRALTELTVDALETVLELISQNSLYRGEENKSVIVKFLQHKKEFDKLETTHLKELYTWDKSVEESGAITGIRNTSIGTLLVDISEGTDLEVAVNKFERMVAGTNYKRPTAIVTKSQVDKFQKEIVELGYGDSLERRYAVLDDIKVNNVIYVDRDSKKSLGIFDKLKDSVKENPKSFSKVEEISIDKFVSDVLPNVTSMQVLFENHQLNNLVSLIAPLNQDSKSMLKWDNNFSWSYANAVADSFKEKSKRCRW